MRVPAAQMESGEGSMPTGPSTPGAGDQSATLLLAEAIQIVKAAGEAMRAEEEAALASPAGAGAGAGKPQPQENGSLSAAPEQAAQAGRWCMCAWCPARLRTGAQSPHTV